MGLWDMLGKAANYLSEEATKKLAESQEELARETTRLQHLSEDELRDTMRRDGVPYARRVAAKQMLESRAAGVSGEDGGGRATTPHYNAGRTDIKVGFILSAPGRYEAQAGRPAAGQTGANLDRVIANLRKQYPDMFVSEHRYDYTITNASTDVHYRAATGDTEGTDSAILDEANLDRVVSEVGDLDIVICLGDKAGLVASRLRERGFSGKICTSIHVGMTAINSKIKEDADGVPIRRGDPDATERRLGRIAKEIGDDIRRKPRG